MSKKIVIGFMGFILIWISILVQSNILNTIPLFGVSANIGIVITVGIGLLSDKIPGAITGATYGIIYDLMFGKSIGTYFFIYTILGIVSGKLSKGFSKDYKMSMVYMVALFTAITEIVTYLAFVFIYNYSFEFVQMMFVLLMETIYNMILASLLFKPLKFMGEIINKSKNSYYLF